MKVLLVNGSPHKIGCTQRALQEVANSLTANGIETEFFWIGNKPLIGCNGCKACLKTGRCVFNDSVNELLDKIDASPYYGYIFGTPVHYASASGAITSFMDRLFYGKAARFNLKPAAAIASCRRGGSSATLDQIQKYFGISDMLTVGSSYWNMVHGNTPTEVEQDLEGLQTMRTIGNNMAWLIKNIEAGKKAGLESPVKEEKIWTGFAR